MSVHIISRTFPPPRTAKLYYNTFTSHAKNSITEIPDRSWRSTILQSVYKDATFLSVLRNTSFSRFAL